MFQTRTGFPGHLAEILAVMLCLASGRFQTRTGFPGHLATSDGELILDNAMVSNPNGLPRPFSQVVVGGCRVIVSWFQTRTGFPGHFAHSTAPDYHLNLGVS